MRAAVAHPYSLALRRIRAELQHRAAAAGPSQAAADRAVLGAREPDARVLAGNPSQRAESPIDSVPSACLAVRFVCRLNRFRIAETFPRHRSGARTVWLLAAARTMPRKMRIRCARHMAALHCDCFHSVQQGSALRTQGARFSFGVGAGFVRGSTLSRHRLWFSSSTTSPRPSRACTSWCSSSCHG